MLKPKQMMKPSHNKTSKASPMVRWEWSSEGTHFIEIKRTIQRIKNNQQDLVPTCEELQVYELISHPVEKPKSESSILRSGYARRTSSALGNVVLSGMVIWLFNPHIEESTTKRGGRESLSARPSRPTANFSPNSAWASASVPGYL